jgi:hypothetical protein
MTNTADPGLSKILRDETNRTFDAPWQAQAFALVVRLSGPLMRLDVRSDSLAEGVEFELSVDFETLQ